MHSRYFLLLALAAIAAAGFGVYANTFDGGWVWDDASSVLLHKHVQEPARLIAGVGTGEVYIAALPGKLLGAFAQLYREDQHAFGRGQGNFYRPLLSTSFALDYILAWPGAPLPNQPPPQPGTFWFHLQSTLWHIATAVALLLVLARLGAARPVQFFVPLLWVVHPLHTEAVAYISGRADMMSGTFLFLGLFLGLSTSTGRRRQAAWLGSALCFALGLLSKEATLLFPFVLAALILVRIFSLSHPLRGERTGVSEEDIPHIPWYRALTPVYYSLGVLLVYILLRSTLLKFASGGGGAAKSTFGTRVYETMQSLALYAKLLVWPTHLHMERTLDGVGTLTAWAGFLLLLLLIAALVWSLLRSRARIAAGLALFIICWLPISGLFPLNAPMAEHWMYVPMAGLLWAMAEAAVLLPRPARIAAAVTAVCFIVGFSLQTMRRNEDWDNNVRLFTATLRENPRSMRVHYNLAVTYEDIEGNTAGALRHYAAAAALGGNPPSPDAVDAMVSAAALLIDEGRPVEALAIYQKLQESRALPEALRAEMALGAARAMLAVGDPQYAQRAASADPSAAAIFRNLAQGAPLSEKLHLPGMLEDRR